MMKDAYKQMNMKKKVTPECVKKFIAKVDRDGDLKIDRNDMLLAMRGHYFKF